MTKAKNRERHLKAVSSEAAHEENLVWAIRDADFYTPEVWRDDTHRREAVAAARMRLEQMAAIQPPRFAEAYTSF